MPGSATPVWCPTRLSSAPRRQAIEDYVALRLRDGRRLDPQPANDVLAGIGALVGARSTELWDDER